DYNIVTASTTLNVLKATPVITWANPADITYGTALSGTQLNATVTGTGPAPIGPVTYSPAAGTVLDAGSHQPLTVNVAGTNDYNPASATVSINVTPAPLTVTPDDASKTYGTDNPVLTGQIVGIKNGDTITASYRTVATAASHVGAYDITATLVDPGNKA